MGFEKKRPQVTKHQAILTDALISGFAVFLRKDPFLLAFEHIVKYKLSCKLRKCNQMEHFLERDNLNIWC